MVGGFISRNLLKTGSSSSSRTSGISHSKTLIASTRSTARCFSGTVEESEVKGSDSVDVPRTVALRSVAGLDKVGNGISSSRSPARPKLEMLFGNNSSFKKTVLSRFLLPSQKGMKVDSPITRLVSRSLPGPHSSLDYMVMQYLLNAKRKTSFDPVLGLSHFVPLRTEGSGDGEGVRSSEKRVRSRIGYFVESVATEEKEKTLSESIRLGNDLSFDGKGRNANAMILSPFNGAAYLLLRDGLGLYDKLSFEKDREKLLETLKKALPNLLGKGRGTGLTDTLIERNGIGELTKGVGLMTEIMLRNRNIPYGYNKYLNEEKKMRSIFSRRLRANTLIKSVKIKSIYQSASMIAQDIAFRIKRGQGAFRSIAYRMVNDIPPVMKKRVKGMRISFSGRPKGVEIARSEVVTFGKTSRTVINQKMDYACVHVPTSSGISGIKVWIFYNNRKQISGKDKQPLRSEQ